MTSYRFKRDADKLPMSELNDVMSLGDSTELDVIATTSTAQGTQLVKMQEKFKGEKKKIKGEKKVIMSFNP